MDKTFLADLIDIRYWAGTDESLASYMMAIKQMVQAGGVVTTPTGQAEEAPVPRLFSKVGDVGVIRIAGSLTNSDSPYLKYFGMTGYPEVRAALVHAANDASVGAVVLDIASGGGAVAGLSDTADLIAMIDKGVKPVHAFTDSGMMSAAYWLGVTARSVTIGKVAEVGSIGVLTVHQEMSKMLADAGINVTVVRSGKYKALGNPYEPLSKTAEEQLQAQVDQLAGMFTAHVAEQLDTTVALVDSKMGQGRVFIGQAAVDIGLAGKVASFDSLLAKVQGGIDSKKEASKYGANFPKGTPVKAALTEQQVALLALGGSTGEQTETTPTAPAADTSEGTATDETAPAAPAAEGGEPAKATAEFADTAVVDFLKGQLAEANTKVTDLTIEVRDTKAALGTATANQPAMRKVVDNSVQTLRVALGHSKSDTAAMSDAQLLAEHDSLLTQFNAKFKAGGVAASTPATSAEKEGSNTANDSRRAARIAATRPTTK